MILPPAVTHRDEQHQHVCMCVCVCVYTDVIKVRIKITRIINNSGNLVNIHRLINAVVHCFADLGLGLGLDLGLDLGLRLGFPVWDWG